MNLPCTLPLRVAVLASILSMSSAWAVALSAPTAPATPPKIPADASDALGAAVALNLLSGPRATQPRVAVRTLGTGRWVCTPAGSGQRSRCFRN